MRSIKRSKKHEQVIRLLAAQNSDLKEKPVFSSMREVQTFAAILGYDQGKKTSLSNDLFEIDSRIIERSPETMITIDLLAVAVTGGFDILDSSMEEERIRIFEECAEGGFEILSEWLNALPQDPFGENAILAGLIENGYIENSKSHNPDDILTKVHF